MNLIRVPYRYMIAATMVAAFVGCLVIGLSLGGDAMLALLFSGVAAALAAVSSIAFWVVNRQMMTDMGFRF